MNKKFLFTLIALLTLFLVQSCNATSVRLTVPLDGRTDYTALVRDLLRAHPEGQFVLEFASGVYDFYPEQAEKEFLRVSNNDNGVKHILFLLRKMQNVTICGHHTQFRLHGELVPFYIDHCEEVTLRGISVNYDLPFVMEGLVIGQNDQTHSIDLKITSGNPVKVVDNELIFSGYHWEQTLGDNIVFDPQTRAPYYNTARFLHPYWKGRLTAEMVGRDTVRLAGFKSPELPPVGSVYIDKGSFRSNRRCPGIVVHRTRNLKIEKTTVHASGAMALICENTENVLLEKFNVCTEKGSGRYISASADATHFVNCRGLIRFEGCLFESMLDDATNIHGTYMVVDSLCDKRSLTVHFGHCQQQGFDFARVGDTLRLINRTNLQSVETFVVAEARPLNNEQWEIRSTRPLSVSSPEHLAIENPFNMPSVVMRHCIVRNNRARSILLSTPRPVTIERNYFSSMMAGILIAGDANSWFESGSVKDIVIRHNTFVNMGTGGENPQSVLQISPEIPLSGRGDNFYYHGRIVFEGNTVRTFDSQVIYALSTSQLEIRNNRFIQSHDYQPIFKGLTYIDLQHCKQAEISGNRFKGDRTVEVSAVGCEQVRIGAGQRGFAPQPIVKPNDFFYKQ